MDSTINAQFVCTSRNGVPARETFEKAFPDYIWDKGTRFFVKGEEVLTFVVKKTMDSVAVLNVSEFFHRTDGAA